MYTIDFIHSIIVISFFTLSIVYILYTGLDLIDSLSTYHKRSERSRNIFKIVNEESFRQKVLSTFYTSAILSLPFILVFSIVIPQINIFYEYGYGYGYEYEYINFSLILFLTLTLLGSIRLLSNPTKRFPPKKIKDIALKVRLDWGNKGEVETFFKDDRVKKICENYKERVISSSYTLLFVIFFLLYIIIINSIFSSQTNISIDVAIFNIYSSIFYLLSYYTSLFIFSFFIEVVLLTLEPIIEEEDDFKEYNKKIDKWRSNEI